VAPPLVLLENLMRGHKLPDLHKQFIFHRFLDKFHEYIQESVQADKTDQKIRGIEEKLSQF